MRRQLAAVTAGALLALVAGCSGPGSTAGWSSPTGCPSTFTGGPDAGPPQMPAGCPTPSRVPPSSSAAVSPMDAGLPTVGLAAPSWDAAAAQSAKDTAFGAMQAFVHTEVGGRPVDATAWFAGLASYLSLPAQRAYYGTDPARVPAHTVFGVYPRAGSSPYLAVADVGTDVGTYEVLLSRVDGSASWTVERLDPPAGVR